MARARTRHAARSPAVALLALLLAAGCSGQSLPHPSGQEPGAPHRRGAGTVTVDVRDSEVGPILVDEEGMSLYVFSADRGGRSACGIDCAQYWPSLSLPSSGHAETGPDARASLLGRGQAVGPNHLITYAGRPLYDFSSDGEPGDTKGQDLRQFGGVWHLLSPSGQPISRRTSDSLAAP